MLLPVALFVAASAVAVPDEGKLPQGIVKIEFKDQKKAKNYKDNCVEINEDLILIGEVKSGVELKDNTYVVKVGKGAPPVELWVTDMNNPKVCPYKIDAKGEKQRGAGKCVLSLNSEDIKGVQQFMPDQSFWGMTKEYARRDEEIDDIKKQRDAAHKGTKEWRDKENALIQSMSRLKSWLEETIYKRSAKRVAKEIEAETKAAKEASVQRLALAKASVKLVAVPDDLKADAKQCYGDAVSFHMQESTHVRIIYREEVGDERVKGLMELAETLIDGFRVSFVDPYSDKEDFKDYIPDDHMFAEWFFGPDDQNQYMQFIAKHYGYKDPDDSHKEARAKLPGRETHRGNAPQWCHMWRAEEKADLDGMISHELGHDLVHLHYNQDRSNDVSNWLYEGVGNWLSLEYLGRNNIQCVDFKDLEYAKRLKGQTGETNLLKGTADLYHRVALDKGPTIDQLALKVLAQFEDEDVAKAFSFFNFIAKTQGEKGQRLLRACCNAGGIPNQLIPQWRKKADEVYGNSGKDVFKKLEEDWKKYAEEQIGGPLKK